MKIALVHDWLTGMRGGERCLQVFLSMYPNADIFTLLHVPGSTSSQIDARVRETSFVGKFPAAAKFYRHLLPLYPAAIKQFSFEGYDLVISLSHAAAKNIRVPSGTPHLCYCFTPMRYIWDQAQRYFGALTPAVWPLIRWLRDWDGAGAARVDELVAISRFVAARIRCFYNREARVIYPPVDTSWIRPICDRGDGSAQIGEAFLYAGALVPYKRVDLVVKSFNQLGLPLWIVGAGPDEKRLKSMARDNITFFGHVSDRELAEFYKHARALIFPAREDFGLIPVECMAAGRPVIGLHAAALRETLIALKPWNEKHNSSLDASQVTGVFMPCRAADEVGALNAAIRYFIDKEGFFKPSACVTQAAKFSVRRFFESWESLVLEHIGLPGKRYSRVPFCDPRFAP